MKIVAFIKTQHPDHQKKTQAVCDGMSKHGLSVTVRSMFDKPVPCDLAVIRGMKKKNRPMRLQQEAKRKDFLVMEDGYINPPKSKWMTLGFNGLNGRSEFMNKDCPPDRWNKHHSDLMKPWKEKEGTYILVTAQMKGDASMLHLPNRIPDYNEMVKEIKKYTDLPIRFRPHPASFDPRLKRRKVTPPEGTIVTKGKQADLLSEIEGAFCVITHNSNTCVDAVLNGTPCIVQDHGAMAWDVCGQSISEVVNPPRPDRTQWSHNLAYAQWTYKEVSSGEAWGHLKQFYE